MTWTGESEQGLAEQWTARLPSFRGWTPVQAQALQRGLMTGRQNLIVSAPTNTGKTLVGDLACVDALSRGQHAVILEPLRALAQEKAEEWTAQAPHLSHLLGRDITVTLSTGDYRLEDEHFTDVPRTAQITVATPEKLEALLRRPEHHAWFQDIGVVVVDEAHLLSNPRRGPTLELLLARLKALPQPPRFVLLSGTVGDTEAAAQWLAPCALIQVTERVSPLTRSVLPIEEAQDPNTVVTEWVQDVLQDPSHRALVFVYQTASASKLTRHLNATLGAGTAQAYHAQLARKARDAARAAFLQGESRVIVTTTALAMGLNLPCTHVLVRDSAFAGVGRVEAAELLQMLGRAGRGQTPGTGTVLLRTSDSWGAAELERALHEPQFPPLISAFERLDPSDDRPAEQVVATLLAAQAAPTPAATLEGVLGHSLGGRHLSGQVRRALNSLVRQKLAFQSDVDAAAPGAPLAYGLTWVGRQAVRSVLPLNVAAGYTQLIRDLMSVDGRDELLEHWQQMDTLLLANLLHERPPNLGLRWSESLARDVDAWCDRYGGEAPRLSAFVRGDAQVSRAEELLGSLGLPLPSGKKAKADARKTAYLALARAAILLERSKGRAASDIERTWGIKNLEGVEERWRDDLLWLLGGLTDLIDLKAFLYHLKEHCGASDARLKRLKGALRRQRQQNYTLLEALKRCSPLGVLLDAVRRQQLGRKPKIGLGSIQRLEAAGITSLAELQRLDVDQLHALGLRRDFALQLTRYLRRRRAT